MTCEKATSKLRRKLIVPKMNVKCKKIKCANVDEPQCVRMRREDLSVTIHFIAANKCELEYMKCHDDLEAKIVPMKYCSHNVDQTAGKKINRNMTGKAHIRVKRRINTIKPIQRKGETNTNNKSKHHKLKKSRTNSKKLVLQWKNEDSNAISKDNDNRSTMKGHGPGQHARLAIGYPFSSDTDSDMEHNERKKIKKGIAGHLLHPDITAEDTGSSVEHRPLQPKAFISPRVIGMKGNRPYVLAQIVGSSFWKSEDLVPEFPILSQENFTEEILTEADKIEYEQKCPTVCPSRDVMVCGKCQHGIYRTFLSVCHLRMFTCNHKDEILQLISRYPCVLSAPYISDTNELRGTVVESGDDDKILRFIICREQGKLGTDDNPSEDPRCNFQPTKDNLKFYDYKGVIMPMDPHLIQAKQYKESSEY